MRIEGQRTLLGALLWSAAALSAPFTTLLWMQYGGVPAAGAGLLSLLVFCSALLCTSLNQRLDEWEEHADDENAPLHVEEPALNGCRGLKILRIGQHSPLRGHINERGVILKVNGVCPSTAAEANQALVEGRNEIEWMGRNGRILLATIVMHEHEHDLMTEFEQLTGKVRRASDIGPSQAASMPSP